MIARAAVLAVRANLPSWVLLVALGPLTALTWTVTVVVPLLGDSVPVVRIVALLACVHGAVVAACSASPVPWLEQVAAADARLLRLGLALLALLALVVMALLSAVPAAPEVAGVYLRNSLFAAGLAYIVHAASPALAQVLPLAYALACFAGGWDRAGVAGYRPRWWALVIQPPEKVWAVAVVVLALGLLVRALRPGPVR